MFAELYITDGDSKLDLLGVNKKSPTGVALKRMMLSRAQREPSGVFRQTYGAVNESYDISISGFTPDEVALVQQKLDRWLEQAKNFFETNAENRLVWLVARALRETNYRYAVVYGGLIESYGDVYNQPFMGGRIYTLNDITLGLERSTWLGYPPYEALCMPVHNVHTWNPNPTTITSSRSMSNVQSLFTTSVGTILAASNLVDRSSDSGANWTNEITTGVANLRFWDFLQQGAGRIWLVAGMTTGAANAASGIYYSDDDGLNWTQHTASVDFYSIGYRSRDNTLFFGGEGEVRYIQNSGALTVLSTIPTGRCKAMAVDADGNVVIGDEYNLWRIPATELSLYRTTMGFVIPTDTTVNYLVALSLDDYFLVGNATNIFISRDQGRSWDTYWRTWGVDTIYQLDNGTLLASRSGNTGVYRSDDGGFSWNTFITASAQPTRAITELGDTYLFLGSSGAVYRRVAVDAVNYFGQTDYDCGTVALVANHRLESNWTHIFIYDSSANSYTTITPAQVNAMVENQTDQLAFPSPVGTSDAMYIGISTSVLDAGPFSNVYIQLTDVNYTLTLAVEYYNGSAWTALVQSTNMDDLTGSLKRSGLISWALPVGTSMATVSINSVTAWWIRIRVTATGTLSTQLPKFRNVYMVQKPYIEFENVHGDIPALAKALIGNETYFQSSVMATLHDKMLLGLRSLERGEGFTSIINFARIQNPSGITVSLGPYSAWITDPTRAAAGEYVKMTVGGVDDSYFTIADIAFDSKMANDFAGVYQVYIRLKRSGGSTLASNCRLRLSVQSFSDTAVVDPGIKTEDVYLEISPIDPTGDYAATYYMGQIHFRPEMFLGENDSTYRSQIRVQCHPIGGVTNYEVSIFDIILIPADEWIGRFEMTSWAEGRLTSGDHLLVDSASFPKRVLRSLLRLRGTEQVNSSWTASASGAFILQPGGRQRLWFFTDSNHSSVFSAKLWHNPRWLALRGND